MGRRWDRLWVYFTIIRALNGHPAPVGVPPSRLAFAQCVICVGDDVSANGLNMVRRPCRNVVLFSPRRDAGARWGCVQIRVCVGCFLASARRLSEHCYLLALANKQAQGLRFGGTLKSGMCVSGEAGTRPALWLSRTS